MPRDQVKAREYRQLARDAFKRAGLCSKCGHVKERKSHNTCLRCRRLEAKYDRKRAIRVLKQKSDLVTERRSLGICTRCGGTKETTEYMRCLGCRKIERARNGSLNNTKIACSSDRN